MSRRNSQSTGPISSAIRQIAADNASGAAEILTRAGAVLTLLNAHSSEEQAGDAEWAQQEVIDTCAALALTHPDMGPLLRLASEALSAARTSVDPRLALQAAQDAALNFIETAERAARDAAGHAAGLIRDGASVLTHSRSSTVLAALFEAKRRGRGFSVISTESRPMLEGRALAEALSEQGFRVALIADAAAALAMDRVDLVLMGADKITPLVLVNKIGTRMIALAARERGLPVYGICDGSKFIQEDYFGGTMGDPENPAELWPESPEGVEVVNRYFEPTPLEWFTGIITEEGGLSIRNAAARAERASIDRELLHALEALRGRIK